MSKVKMNKLIWTYSGNIYLLIDGAAISNIKSIVTSCDPKNECIDLYYDTEYEDFCSISPCIIHVNASSNIMDKFRNQKKYYDASILIGYQGNIVSLKKILSSNIEARTPSGNIVLFRFYDPHVLSMLIKEDEHGLLRDIFHEINFVAYFPDIMCYNDDEREIYIYNMPNGNMVL